MSSTQLRPLDRDLAATVALTAYSIVVGLGLARVFGGWDFADDVIAIVIVVARITEVLRLEERQVGVGEGD